MSVPGNFCQRDYAPLEALQRWISPPDAAAGGGEAHLPLHRHPQSIIGECLAD